MHRYVRKDAVQSGFAGLVDSVIYKLNPYSESYLVAVGLCTLGLCNFCRYSLENIRAVNQYSPILKGIGRSILDEVYLVGIDFRELELSKQVIPVIVQGLVCELIKLQFNNYLVSEIVDEILRYCKLLDLPSEIRRYGRIDLGRELKFYVVEAACTRSFDSVHDMCQGSSH